MTTTVEAETLRECIEGGGRGDFAQALLALYDQPDLKAMRRADCIADNANGVALRDATQAAFAGGLGWRNSLLLHFPGLARLGEPTDNPHAIPLRGEQP